MCPGSVLQERVREGWQRYPMTREPYFYSCLENENAAGLFPNRHTSLVSALRALLLSHAPGHVSVLSNSQAAQLTAGNVSHCSLWSLCSVLSSLSRHLSALLSLPGEMQ